MISGVIFLQWAGEKEGGRGRRKRGRQRGEEEERERRQTSNLGCHLGVGRRKECCGSVGISHTLSLGNAGVAFNRSIIIQREPGRDEEMAAEEERILRQPFSLTSSQP